MKTTLNQKETKRIGAWLETIGATITNQNGDILHHATAPHNGLKKWKNEAGDSFKILFNRYHIHYEAGINAAGIGDGQKPDKAITYSLGCSIEVMRKNYRCRHEYQDEVKKFYAYSRTKVCSW